MFCKHLNISFDPLRDMSVIERFPLHLSAKYKLDNSEISEEMIEFMKSIGAVHWEVELFTSSQNYVLLPHTDDCHYGNYAKINFVYCDDDNHTMDWYEPLSQPKVVKPSYSDSREGDSHYRFSMDGVRLLHQETIKVALVNVGIPHGITTKLRRQCVSFIISLDIAGEVSDLTMENFPDTLKEYLI